MNVNCEFSYNLNYYQCEVKFAGIRRRNIKVSAVLGEHLVGKSNNDVGILRFENIEMKFFPQGFGQLFPYLNVLEIINCGLKEITKKDLAGLENLTELEIRNNELVSLPSDLLEDMERLNQISFAQNNLKFVDSKMFEHLKNKLQYLVLQNNRNIQISFNRRSRNTFSFDDVMKQIDENFAKPEENPRRIDHKKAHMVFEQLWDTRRFADFTIKVNKNRDLKEFKVHKNVLGAQSSVFAAMFTNDMDEKRSSEMTISDFSSSSVEELLQYLYTGLFPDETNAMEIFELAAKYDIENLKPEMEELIIDNIDGINALEVFLFGNLHKSEDIILAAFEEVRYANPEIKFADHLKFKPEKIKQLIEAKRQHDKIISDTQKELNDLEARLNSE